MAIHKKDYLQVVVRETLRFALFFLLAVFFLLVATLGRLWITVYLQ